MVDLEILQYTISEISKNINKPYVMNNSNLANELLPNLKKEFPSIELIEFGITQYFVVNVRAKKKLKNNLHFIENKLSVDLYNVREIISNL